MILSAHKKVYRDKISTFPAIITIDIIYNCIVKIYDVVKVFSVNVNVNRGRRGGFLKTCVQCFVLLKSCHMLIRLLPPRIPAHGLNHRPVYASARFSMKGICRLSSGSPLLDNYTNLLIHQREFFCSPGAKCNFRQIRV